MRFIGLLIATPLLLTAAACGQGVSGNSAYVTVSNVWSDSDALPKAQAHCESYGKTARFRYIDKYRATFDCVNT